MKISIIIVTYNSKYYIALLLDSLLKAVKNLDAEIIIVDNASKDSTVSCIRENFSELITKERIQIIENSDNLGFSKANNLGLARSGGEIIAMVNPDIIVEEKTFEQIIEKFQNFPGIAGIAPKILNPDGSFAIDSRHAIPDPKIAFWKAIGFQKLFPKHRIFGQYNLTYLNENMEYDIPALSGSFMVFRKSVLDRIGGLDEQFFMYCEDIDLCKRISDFGMKIRYCPDIRVLHFKGESTQKKNFNYVKTFNESMLLFYQKHFKEKMNPWWNILIQTGVWARGLLIFLKNNISRWWHLLVAAGIITTGSIMFSLQPIVAVAGVLLYLFLFEVLNPPEIKFLKTTSSLIAFSLVVFNLIWLDTRLMPDMLWKTGAIFFIILLYYLLLIPGEKVENSPEQKPGYFAQILSSKLKWDEKIFTQFLKHRLVITGVLSPDKINAVNSVFNSEAIICNTEESISKFFDFMEKNPGKYYLFWDREKGYLAGDGISGDLNHSPETNPNPSWKCRIWAGVFTGLSKPFFNKNQSVKYGNYEEKNTRILNKVKQQIMYLADVTQKCTEKMSYLWLFFQLNWKQRNYFRK